MTTEGHHEVISFETAKQIFENLPNDARPSWAGNILACFDSHIISKIPTEILDLYPIIIDKYKWNKAHNQFSRIRDLLLQYTSAYPPNYLSLAELVAKVTYNASGALDEFDEDSGHYIPSFALSLAESMNNIMLMEEVKSAILLTDIESTERILAERIARSAAYNSTLPKAGRSWWQKLFGSQ